MKKIIKGKFEVKGTPLTIDETAQTIGAMRMKFEKRFEGALDAQSTVSMIGILDQKIGSGGYVALEKVDGNLDGRRGTFCLQHSCTMNRGAQTQQILVVPDTGTDELQGLCGDMTIEIAPDGQHFYTFEYEFR